MRAHHSTVLGTQTRKLRVTITPSHSRLVQQKINRCWCFWIKSIKNVNQSVCDSTRQEQSWQRSVGWGKRSPLKQPRPLKLHPSHTPHAQPSRAGCGQDTAGHIRRAHTTSPLYGKQRTKIRCTAAVRDAASQRPQRECTHWACALLAPSLSSREDLSVSISHASEMTACAQSDTSMSHLLYITWAVV